jgi:ABC-type sugar transport system ATPase subunit
VAAVVLENVTKVFRSRHGPDRSAVSRLTLEVADGELFVLAGPSGSGKTTVLRLIAGLDTPTQGRVLLDGSDAANTPPERRNVAMVFQNSVLYPHMTIWENLAFGLRVRRVSAAQIQERVLEVAGLTGIADCLERLPSEISGGQRQRAALARALARSPGILLMDEPLSNLDPPLRSQVRNEIIRLQRQLKTTLVYVTHDQFEALSLGDRVGLLKGGQLQQVGDPNRVYCQPASLFAGRFFGQPPLNLARCLLSHQEEQALLVEQKEDWTRADQGFSVVLPVTPKKFSLNLEEKRVLLGIRPEDISVVPLDAISSGTIKATVLDLQEIGPDRYLHATTATHSFVARLREASKFTKGQQVGLHFKPAALLLFDPKTEVAIALEARPS